MSSVTGGETELAVGDTIQLDKGLHIVECVGKDTADCLPLDDKNKGKPRTVQTPFPRHLVISRGGKPALDKFLSQPPKAKPGHVLLEPGDRLVHMGGHCTVVSVLDKKCVIGNLDGMEFYEDRLVNEYRLTDVCTHKPARLNEAERAANLEQFLQQRKSPQPETEETSDEKEKETSMKTAKTAKSRTNTPKTSVKRSRSVSAPVLGDDRKNGSKAIPAPANDSSKKLFGASIVRVAMAVGAKGGDYGKFMTVLAKHGLCAKESTVKSNMRHGKNGMKGADLTADQLKEFGL